MIRVVILLLLVLITFPAMAGIGVVSSAVCADQAVVALVEPARIAALSPQARNPRLSAVAAQAEGLPVLSLATEAFVLIGADVVVGVAWSETRTLAMMERLGARIVRLETAKNFTEIASLLRSSAAALGVPMRGERLAADLEWRLALLAKKRPARPLRAIYVRPDGGSAGGGTFVDAALSAAGFESLVTSLGRNGWGRLDLEILIMNQPEVIIAAFFDHPDRSLSRRFAQHPVFRALWGRVPVIEVPGALMSCGAWPLIEAAELLAHHRAGLPAVKDQL